MKSIFLIYCLILFFPLSLSAQDPYFLKLATPFPEIELPEDLKIEGIQGEIIVKVALDEDANILNLDWIVLLLKNKGGNTFIEYREAVSKSFTIKDYPKPVRLYYEFMQEEIKKIEFIRNENLPKPIGNWSYIIPYSVK